MVSCGKTLSGKTTIIRQHMQDQKINQFGSPPLVASGTAVSAGTVGEDELAYTVDPAGVENLDVTAQMEIQRLMCHPTSITSFSSDHYCVTAVTSGSQGVSIGSFGDDRSVEDYRMPAGPPTISGITEVVVMAEVCDLLCIHSD